MYFYGVLLTHAIFSLLAYDLMGKWQYRGCQRSNGSIFFWSMAKSCWHASCWCHIISACWFLPLLWGGCLNCGPSFSGVFLYLFTTHTKMYFFFLFAFGECCQILLFLFCSLPVSKYQIMACYVFFLSVCGWMCLLCIITMSRCVFSAGFVCIII